MAFVHRELGAPWPDVSDAALLESVEEWLGVELGRARRRADLERIDAGQALARLLPWASGDAVRFDELAPERIEVPSGSRVRVDYGGAQPVLAVKLQELFGWQESPRVAAWAGAGAGASALPRGASGRRHGRSRLLLAGRIPVRARGVARPLSEASLAGGSFDGGADAAYVGAAQAGLSAGPEGRGGGSVTSWVHVTGRH